MVRVAAYIRVSTDEQADKGNSLTEQRERLGAYCKAMGWGEPIYFEDDGYSAKDLKRPAAQEMIARAEAFDIVLTSKLDRMSRNLLDMLQLVKYLEENSCRFVSSTEGFDTSTAVGRMVLQLLATFAEFERERNSERVKDNMLSLARNTSMPLGKTVYGLLTENKEYIIDPEEALVVEDMATFAEQGNGYRMIALKLNEKGYRTRKGTSWDQINVKRVLNNHAISGTMIFNMRKTVNGRTVIRDKSEWVIKENNHPAIIARDRHLKILEILESRKPAKKHADSETYLFSGLIFCGHCGRTMAGSTARVRRSNKKYDYYRYTCQSYQKGYGCKYHAVHRDDIETSIIGDIQRIIDSDQTDLNIEMAPLATVKGELDDLQNALSRIDRRMQKHIEAYSDELISAADLKTATLKSEKERDDIRSRIEKAKSKKPSIESFRKNLKNVLPELLDADRVVAKNAIRKVISKIELFDGHAVKVIFRQPV